MATKKNAKKDEMMHDHGMMMGHGHKGMGIIYVVLGIFFIYIAYMQSMQLTGVLLLLGVAVWFLSSGFGKLGYGWGMGCGCGCGCCGGCNCDWEDKKN